MSDQSAVVWREKNKKLSFRPLIQWRKVRNWGYEHQMNFFFEKYTVTIYNNVVPVYLPQSIVNRCFTVKCVSF